MSACAAACARRRGCTTYHGWPVDLLQAGGDDVGALERELARGGEILLRKQPASDV